MKIEKILLEKFIGLIIFFISVLIINLLNQVVSSKTLSQIAHFINSSIVILVVISILFMLGEILFAVFFPFNMLGPIINAFGAVLLTKFILSIFGLLDTLMGIKIFYFFWPLKFLIYPVVFLAVIFGGYITLLTRKIKPRRKRKKHKVIDI